MPCGHPRFRSKASNPPAASAYRHAASSTSGSLPQNCATKGRSPAAVAKALRRYTELAGALQMAAWIMGV